MSLTGKKLLLLGGAGPHCKVVESAKEMGIYTAVADYLTDSPAKQIADEEILANIFDVDLLTEYGKKKQIDGVLGFCLDPTQRPAREIAERLGLPVFGTKEQVLALTDKKVFKQVCVETGVDIIPEYTEEDILNDQIEYPVLVKPTDSRGSRGSAVCYSKDELLAALPNARKESSDNGVIIEKYMGGHQDLTISYVVKNGEPTLVSIGDRYSGRREDNLERQLSCTFQPSRYAKMYMEKVNDRVVHMIKSLGIKNAPVFFQGFVDGDTVRMYDPGIRFPGNEYERIYKKAVGIDLMKSIISYVVGDEINDYDGALQGSYDLNGKCAIQYMINVRQGKITVFEGLEEIAKHSNVIDVQQRHFVGSVIEETGDIRHRAGEISMLVDRDPKRIREMIQYVQSQLKILDEYGNNMIISPINVNMIESNYVK